MKRSLECIGVAGLSGAGSSSARSRGRDAAAQEIDGAVRERGFGPSYGKARVLVASSPQRGGRLANTKKKKKKKNRKKNTEGLALAGDKIGPSVDSGLGADKSETSSSTMPSSDIWARKLKRRRLLVGATGTAREEPRKRSFNPFSRKSARSTTKATTKAATVCTPGTATVAASADQHASNGQKSALRQSSENLGARANGGALSCSSTGLSIEQSRPLWRGARAAASSSTSAAFQRAAAKAGLSGPVRVRAATSGLAGYAANTGKESRANSNLGSRSISNCGNGGRSITKTSTSRTGANSTTVTTAVAKSKSESNTKLQNEGVGNEGVDDGLSAYERARLERIRKNQAMLASLGLLGSGDALGDKATKERVERERLERAAALEREQEEREKREREKQEKRERKRARERAHAKAVSADAADARRRKRAQENANFVKLDLKRGKRWRQKGFKQREKCGYGAKRGKVWGKGKAKWGEEGNRFGKLRTGEQTSYSSDAVPGQQKKEMQGTVIESCLEAMAHGGAFNNAGSPRQKATGNKPAPSTAPVCYAHGETCKKWRVKKAGPNKGREFYSCPMEGKQRCNFFQWVDDSSDVAVAAFMKARAEDSKTSTRGADEGSQRGPNQSSATRVDPVFRRVVAEASRQWRCLTVSELRALAKSKGVVFGGTKADGKLKALAKGTIRLPKNAKKDALVLALAEEMIVKWTARDDDDELGKAYLHSRSEDIDANESAGDDDDDDDDDDDEGEDGNNSDVLSMSEGESDSDHELELELDMDDAADLNSEEMVQTAAAGPLPRRWRKASREVIEAARKAAAQAKVTSASSSFLARRVRESNERVSSSTSCSLSSSSSSTKPTDLRDDSPYLLSQLQRYFGFPSFREGQEWAIRRCLRGQSSLLVQPTGLGKSLCYQLPAALLRSRGLTLVVSPLLSLMADQVEHLPRGIRGACLNSQQSAVETAFVMRQLFLGRVDALFVSPERLFSPSFVRMVCCGRAVGGFGADGAPRAGQSRKEDWMCPTVGCGVKVWGSKSKCFKCDAARPERDADASKTKRAGAGRFPDIALAVVDEAHCVAEWSHNFRPAYLRLGWMLNDKLRARAVLALTATATTRTVAEICRVLRIGEAKIRERAIDPENKEANESEGAPAHDHSDASSANENTTGSSPSKTTGSPTMETATDSTSSGVLCADWRRPNLSFTVSREPDGAVRDRALCELLRDRDFTLCNVCDKESEEAESEYGDCTDNSDTDTKNDGEDEEQPKSVEVAKVDREDPTAGVIIYVFRRAQADNVARLLRQEGMRAVAYHAGIPSVARQRAQSRFMHGKARVIVATVAFGMGLDKPNVRAVIHYSMPKNVESYVQEVGRAGRDGKPARCHCFLGDNDFLAHHSLAHADGVEARSVRLLLEQVFARQNGRGEDKTQLMAPNRFPRPRVVALRASQCESNLDMRSAMVETLLSYLESDSEVGVGTGNGPPVRVLPASSATCEVIFDKASAASLREMSSGSGGEPSKIVLRAVLSLGQQKPMVGDASGANIVSVADEWEAKSVGTVAEKGTVGDVSARARGSVYEICLSKLCAATGLTLQHCKRELYQLQRNMHGVRIRWSEWANFVQILRELDEDASGGERYRSSVASLASRLSAHVNRLEAVRGLKVVKIYELLSRVAEPTAALAIGKGRSGKGKGSLRWMRSDSKAAASTRSIVADVTEYFERAADGLVEEATAAATVEGTRLQSKREHKKEDRLAGGKESRSSDDNFVVPVSSRPPVRLPFMDSERYKELLRGDIRDLVGHEAMLSRRDRENAQALALARAPLAVPAQALLTPRAVASILHGLSSPRSGLDKWGNTRYWRLHRGFRFSDIVNEARGILRAKIILSKGGL